jgi:small multidrug resistance pump
MNLTLLIECWASLAIAIIFGVLGTISMKISHGLEHVKPAISLAIFYTISFVAMTFAMKYLELSVVYAVWSGIGTVLVSIVGVMYFGERLSLRKITFLLLIVCGVIGIHFGDGISTV